MIKRLKNDKGASVTIMGISVIVLTLLIAIFVVDFAKLSYMRNVYSSYTQKAALTAVKQQDSIGGLKPESATALVKEYLIQRDGAVNTADAKVYSSSCTIKGAYPKITIKYGNGRSKTITGDSVTSINRQMPTITNGQEFFRKQYNTIQVEVTDVTDNYFFGIFGHPCAEVKTVASAVSTSSQDIDEVRR